MQNDVKNRVLIVPMMNKYIGNMILLCTGWIFFNFYISTMIASYFPIYRGGVGWYGRGCKLWVFMAS